MKKLILALLLLGGTAYGVSQVQTGGIADSAVTNAKIANMAQSTIKGRAAAAGTGVPTDLTATQATAILNAFTGDSGAGGVKGVVPAPSAGDTGLGKFLHSSGGWSVPPAPISAHSSLTGLTSGDDHTQYSLLAGRSGGQTQYGNTASGGNYTLSSTAHATKGKINFGSAATSYWDEANTKMVLKAGSSNIDQLCVNSSGSTGYCLGTVGTGSGQLFLESGSTVYDLWTAGWHSFGASGAAPKYSFDFNQTAASTSLADIVYNSGSYNLSAIALRNFSNTANTHSEVLFSGGNSTQEPDVQLVATHESTTLGAETGNFQVRTRNSGTTTTRFKVGSDGTLTASAYVGGIPKFDSNGAIASVAAPPTNGGVLTSQYGQWVPSVVPVPPCVALGSGVAVDWSLGNCFTKTLSANATFTFSNRVGGQTVIMRITNPGAYTWTLPNTNTAGNSVLWASSVIPTASTAGKKDIVTIFYDGGEMYGNATQGFGGF